MVNGEYTRLGGAAREGWAASGMSPCEILREVRSSACWGSSRRPQTFAAARQPVRPSAGTPYELCPPGMMQRVAPQVSLPFPEVPLVLMEALPCTCWSSGRLFLARAGGVLGEWLWPRWESRGGATAGLPRQGGVFTEAPPPPRGLPSAPLQSRRHRAAERDPF